MPLLGKQFWLKAIDKNSAVQNYEISGNLVSSGSIGVGEIVDRGDTDQNGRGFWRIQSTGQACKR
jgi:hypothetical protein